MAYNTPIQHTQPTISTQQTYNQKTVNILQINTQKSKAACSHLIHIANEKNIDIICIQEPYYINNKIVRFGRWNVLSGNEDTRPKSGIICCNPNLDIAKIPHLCSDRLTTVILQLSDPIIIISTYFSPDDSDEECIKELSNTIRKIKNKRIMVMEDLNGKSPIWFHEKEDNRGRLISDVMNEFDLISTNMTTHPTFYTPHAKGWTDICLVSDNISHLIENCETLLCHSASDHRFILTQIEYNNPTINEQNNPFRKRQTNWTAFRQEFSRIWRNYNFPPITTHEDINNYADFFTNALQSAGRKALQYKSLPPRKTHWWDTSLSQRKKEVDKLRKKYTKTNNDAKKEQYRNQYKEAFKNYKKQINKAQTNSWKKFCSDSNKKGPWELPYYLVMKKQKSSFLPDIINPGNTNNNTDHIDIEENIKSILHYHFPKDNQDDETDEQKQIRNSIRMTTLNNNNKLFTFKEVKKALNSMANRKSP
ncbi:uncharacterized protein LOC111631158 [Centruroides sculpturatus]|uniref:uncharacterized protein LOC111631158 n=1 Tax=Centruroides sculpturatus TaxID=218467 RepID=UPI000C6D59BD|nr:uncharacterized protein LOC111631158 [Centruroides sculpturatus]